jgi:DNA-binding Lrp family transcriptional regulator
MTVETIDDVFEIITDSSLYGNLGMFAGAGFSKSILLDNVDYDALSWRELLKQACENLGADSNVLDSNSSYPEKATQICVKYACVEQIDYREAVAKLKQEIAKLTNWHPTSQSREAYRNYLSCLNLSWIITTNYDLLIESIFTGKVLSLGPKDQLLNPRDIVPVYHLHGTRLDPDSIIITQEDYISLFRPNEYRQVKLPLILKESTTILVGYGLGDVNVLTALDWSRNVYKNESTVNYPHEIIQVLYTNEPNDSPYKDRNGIIIVETNDLKDLLQRLCEYIESKRIKFVEKRENLEKINDALTSPDSEIVKQFVDDSEFRRKIISSLLEYENYLISGFLELLSKVIDETKSRAEPPGAFFAYNQRLKVILDILIVFKVDKMPPSLFSFLASSLEDISYYIGMGVGESWEAYNTWSKRKDEIPEMTIEELKSWAYNKSSSRLKRLLG